MKFGMSKNPETKIIGFEYNSKNGKVEIGGKPLVIEYDGNIYEAFKSGAHQITLKEYKENAENNNDDKTYKIEVRSEDRKSLFGRLTTYFFDKNNGNEIIFKDENTGWKYRLYRNGEKGEGPYFNGQLDMKLIGF